MNTCTKVFLRKKAISGGRISLYLDFYPAIRNPHTNRMSRRETLGIYIYASPKNEREKQFNASMEEKAEAIRCRRFEQLLNEQFDFLDKEKLRMDFLAYFEKKAKSKYDKWMCVYLHFKKFCGGSCTFGDVTASLCEDFFLFGDISFGEGTDLSVHRVLDRWSGRAELVPAGGGADWLKEIREFAREGIFERGEPVEDTDTLVRFENHRLSIERRAELVEMWKQLGES